MTTLPQLPPIGQIGPADHATVITFLQGLAQEAQLELSKWSRLVDDNRRYFHWGGPDEPDDDEVRVNDIQNDVIAITDLQTKEPAHPTLEPVETGEPGECYWAGPPAVGEALGLAAQQVGEWLDEGGQVRPPLPIDPDRADDLRDAVAAGGIPTGAVDPVTGQPQVQRLKERWLVQVDDQLVADTYQSLFDVYWRRSGTDLWNRQNLLKNNVQGWAWGLLEFDETRQRFALRHLSVKQVLVDPTVADIADAAYAGVNLAMDAGEAKALYPHLADVIDENAQQGAPARFDASTSYGGAFDDVNFQRGMVALSVWWLRNHACPYTPEQAVALGLVEQREVSAGAVGSDAEEIDHGLGTDPGNENGALGQPVAGGAAGNPGVGGRAELGDADDAAAGADDRGGPGEPGGRAVDEEGAAPVVPAGQGLAADAGGDAGGAGEEHEPPAGADGAAAAPAAAATRVGLFLAGTDEEVTPLTRADGDGVDAPHPKWPTYPCIRQITVIAGSVVVDDAPCQRLDIPLLHNVCIPVLDRPYGIGEPFRLKTLQRARSKALGTIVEHGQYFGRPMMAVPASIAAALEEEYGDARAAAGKTLIVDDALWQQLGGKIEAVFDPPQTPPALIALVGMLKQETTDQSGNTDVLEGKTSPGVTAASAINLLQQAGVSQIGFKANRTADMVRRQGELMLHDLVRFLSVDDVARVVSRYPRHVLEAIVERARRIEWDVSVEVSAGNGAMQAQKRQEAIEKRKAGAISLESLQEALGVDPRLEKRRMGQEAAEQLQAQAQAAAQVQGAGASAPPPPA
jgi:hypothetical protein